MITETSFQYKEPLRRYDLLRVTALGNGCPSEMMDEMYWHFWRYVYRREEFDQQEYDSLRSKILEITEFKWPSIKELDFLKNRD